MKTLKQELIEFPINCPDESRLQKVEEPFMKRFLSLHYWRQYPHCRIQNFLQSLRAISVGNAFKELTDDTTCISVRIDIPMEVSFTPHFSGCYPEHRTWITNLCRNYPAVEDLLYKLKQSGYEVTLRLSGETQQEKWCISAFFEIYLQGDAEILHEQGNFQRFSTLKT